MIRTDAILRLRGAWKYTAIWAASFVPGRVGLYDGSPRAYARMGVSRRPSTAQCCTMTAFVVIQFMSVSFLMGRPAPGPGCWGP